MKVSNSPEKPLKSNTSRTSISKISPPKSTGYGNNNDELMKRRFKEIRIVIQLMYNLCKKLLVYIHNNRQNVYI